MKLAKIFLLLVTTSLLSALSNAASVTMSFEIVNFVDRNGNGGAPTDPVVGTIVYEAPDILSPIAALTSISLTIGGVPYRLADVGFDSPSLFLPDFDVIGGRLNGAGTVASGTNDFWISFNRITNQPSAFMYSTPTTQANWRSEQFRQFSRTVSPGPQACSTPITPLRQDDIRWSGDPLANTNLTLGGYGCAVTSLSMAINSEPLAVDVLPNQLNEVGKFTSAGGIYWHDTTVNWWKASQPDGQNRLKFRPNSIDSGQFPEAALKYVEDVLCDVRRPVVIHLPNDPPSPFGHFVTVYKIDGDILTAIDPYGGRTREIRLSEKWVTRGYVIDPPDIHSITVAMDDPGTLMLVAPNGMRTGDDGLAAVNEIPESAYFVDRIADKGNSLFGIETTQVTALTPAPGSYEVIVYPTESGVIQLFTSLLAADGSTIQDAVVKKIVTAGVATSVEVNIEPFDATGSVSPANVSYALLQDEIQTCFAQGLISNIGTYRSLMEHVQIAEEAVHDERYEFAGLFLGKIVDEIQRNAGRLIDEDAAEALAGTASELLVELPTVN